MGQPMTSASMPLVRALLPGQQECTATNEPASCLPTGRGRSTLLVLQTSRRPQSESAPKATATSRCQEPD